MQSTVAGDLVVSTTDATKVVTWDHLLSWRDRARCAGRTVVWTNGCFELLHVGHVRCLQAARQLGDALVVGVNGDAAVRRLKGHPRPLVPAEQRAEVLAALACVDYVVVFDEDTPEQALALLRPEIHCKGSDYAPPHGKPIPEASVVAAYGGRVVFFPLASSVSTTSLLQRASSGVAPTSGRPASSRPE